MVRIEPCPDCGADVAMCDNGVRLDVPARASGGDWHIMQLGGLSFAAAGGPRPPDGRGHDLHEHQPPET